MTLILTILTVLAGWALLTVLSVGLLFILKPLQNIRGTLEKIAMGVRAIERQAEPLGPRTEKLIASLGETGEAAAAAGGRLQAVDQDVEAAAPALRHYA